VKNVFGVTKKNGHLVNTNEKIKKVNSTY